jgi:hypothetical protein
MLSMFSHIFYICTFLNVWNLGIQFSSVLTQAANYLSEVRIEGLETLDYIDCLRGKERSTEQGDAIVFESEVK